MKKFRIMLFVCVVCLCAGLMVACEHVHKSVPLGEAIEPTCTRKGLTAGEICENCGEILEPQKPIPARGHDWNGWETITPSTCQTWGERIRTCKVCHDEERDTLPRLKHDWSEWETITPSTCQAKGKRIRTCKVCHDEEWDMLPLLEHDWSEWETIIPSTCQTGGTERRTCRAGEHEETRELPLLAHKWSDWETENAPTCTEKGLERRFCSVCFESESKTIEALRHDFREENVKVLRAPSCVYTGEIALFCTRCGITQPPTIVPMLPHSYRDGVCSVCGRRDWTELNADEPALYHSDYGLMSLSTLEHGTAMQTLYLQIYEDAKIYHDGQSSSEILGEYDYPALGLSYDEAVSVWKTFMDDHPLYYWFGRERNYDPEVLTVRTEKAFCDPARRQSLNRLIYEKADGWRKEAEENAYLASLCYHDAIIGSVDYVYDDGIEPHTVAGVFEGSGAVCEGYARSFQLLLNMTGIPNILVTGKSGNTPHAWNLVCLDDGKWYWFDLTFDDSPKFMWGVKYNYFAVSENASTSWSDGDFLLPDKLFRENHTPDSGNGIEYLPPLPEVSATPYCGVGELLLRETFKVGPMTYAVAGYHKVQLVRCVQTGDVSVPESVRFEERDYCVISIGAMNKDGTFSDLGDVFYGDYKNSLGVLGIPASVLFLWGSALPAYLEAYSVNEENSKYASLDGVLYTKSGYTLVNYPSLAKRSEFRIPDAVHVLAMEAFAPVGADSLRKLTVGKNLEYTGNANWGNNWLNSETDGSYNFIVGEWGEIFYALSGLEEISVDPENKKFSSQDGMLFDREETNLYGYLVSKEELILPASVIRLDDHCAWNTYRLKRIVFLGNRMEKIGRYSIGDNVKEIEFAGTVAEWKNIEKDPRWGALKLEKVICSDATLTGEDI